MTAQKIDDYIKAPKAKLGQNAAAIKQELRGHHMSETTPQIFGRTYTLRTLSPGEDDIAANLVKDGTQLGRGSGLPKATLAVALVAIDGSPVELEFQLPENLDPDMKRILEDPAVLADWRRRAVHEWLLESQPELVDALWQYYLGLTYRKRTALEGIRPLSNPTGTGA